jgi:hypothetical protein
MARASRGPSTMTGSARGQEFGGFGVSVEGLALGEDGGGLGVEVLGSGVVVVVLGGVAAAEEAEDRLAGGVVGVSDRQDEPVLEEVGVVGGAVVALAVGDQTGLFELVEGGALGGEVADQAATAAGRVADRECGRGSLGVGQVGAEAVAEVARCPGAGVAGLEVGHRLLVELEDPLGRDLVGVGEGVLAGDLVGVVLPRHRGQVRVVDARVGGRVPVGVAVWEVGPVSGLVGWLVGEPGDVQRECVGNLDAGQAAVLGDTGEGSVEDVARGPAPVLAGFIDGGHEGGPGGRLLEVVGLGSADEFGQGSAPGGLEQVRGVLVGIKCGRSEVGDKAPPQGGGLVLVGQRTRAYQCAGHSAVHSIWHAG